MDYKSPQGIVYGAYIPGFCIYRLWTRSLLMRTRWAVDYPLDYLDRFMYELHSKLVQFWPCYPKWLISSPPKVAPVLYSTELDVHAPVSVFVSLCHFSCCWAETMFNQTSYPFKIFIFTGPSVAGKTAWVAPQYYNFVGLFEERNILASLYPKRRLFQA